MSELTHGEEVRICASLKVPCTDRVGINLSFHSLLGSRTNDEREYSLGRLKRKIERHTYIVSTLIDPDKQRGVASEFAFSVRQSNPHRDSYTGLRGIW